ncbi:hypothetical protein GQ43DRAFT_471810 [Delitschia confertaspora ATCC 74209]|uniref:Uncharacterized protein n=1 Tax=Delitschia confertaspora ATCC 74209 TaxID=1513339 RepID=A0A9P4JL17_9PLEO|nr:hypothetical protein GQ43DRAFT_471810 [Delitschia confertaspora ATCC 74209]
MIRSADPLASSTTTSTTTCGKLKPADFSYTSVLLYQSSQLVLQVDRDLARKREHMAHRSRSGYHDFWHSMPDEERRTVLGIQEPSAYQATTAATRPKSPNRFLHIPSISTTTTTTSDRSLPSSSESSKGKHKPASLRSLIRRTPSGQHDSTFLQSEARPHQRSSSTNHTLQPYQYSNNQSSRSMPSSPAEFAQASASIDAISSHTQYTAYPKTFEAPRTCRTCPDAATPSSTSSSRQRPHTWLSPTEPFSDESEFHLFVEATSGLPDGLGGFDGMSPTSPPRLQGSLFNNGSSSRAQQIPLPLQRPEQAQSARPSRSPPREHHRQREQRPVSDWEAMGYDYIPSPTHYSSRSHPFSQPSTSGPSLPYRRSSGQSNLTQSMNPLNLELERLGLGGEEEAPPEDELPDYAQSQAEMSEKRRREAARRARELEERWKSASRR